MVTPIKAAPDASLSPELKVQKKRLKEACQDFESVLTGNMFKTMQATVDKAEEPQKDREMFEEMMTQAVSKDLSRSKNGFGVADSLYKQFSTQLKPEAKTIGTI